MSENIQSIANGSFVLGQTSATTYQAGPGISITQPSEGTVRISNDETVLWSGTPQNSGTVQLAESIGNFDRVLLYWTKTADNNNAGNVDIISTVRGVYNLIHHVGSSNAWIQMVRLDYNDTTRQLSFISGKNLNFGAYSATSWTNPSVSSGIGDSFCLFKVVGINRISGSNT